MTEVTFCTKRLYNNPEAGIHVPCWNYLYECSGITGGGIVPPTFFTRKFYDLPRKKGTRKGNGEEMKENLKGKKWKIENRRGKVWKWAEDLLFYLFIYLFIYLFCLSLFETTEICLGSTRMDNFTREKSYFMLGQNQETWLCFLWKILLLRHCTDFQIQL